MQLPGKFEALATTIMLFFHSLSIQWRLLHGNRLAAKLAPHHWEMLNQVLAREVHLQIADCPFNAYAVNPTLQGSVLSLTVGRPYVLKWKGYQLRPLSNDGITILGQFATTLGEGPHHILGETQAVSIARVLMPIGGPVQALVFQCRVDKGAELDQLIGKRFPDIQFPGAIAEHQMPLAPLVV